MSRLEFTQTALRESQNTTCTETYRFTSNANELGQQLATCRGGTIPEIMMRYVSRYLSHDTVTLLGWSIYWTWNPVYLIWTFCATDCIYVKCSIGIACQWLIVTMVVCWELQRGRNRLGSRCWSGHPRGYNEAKWSLGPVYAVSGFEVPELRVCFRVFVSGGELSLVLCWVQTSGVALRGGDQGENVVCVMGCAEVRGLPARQIKSGWFPTDDVNCSTVNCQLSTVNCQRCQLMSTDVNWCQLMSTDVNWCQLMSTDVNWCQLMSTDVNCL